MHGKDRIKDNAYKCFVPVNGIFNCLNDKKTKEVHQVIRDQQEVGFTQQDSQGREPVERTPRRPSQVLAKFGPKR